MNREEFAAGAMNQRGDSLVYLEKRRVREAEGTTKSTNDQENICGNVFLLEGMLPGGVRCGALRWIFAGWCVGVGVANAGVFCGEANNGFQFRLRV